MDPHAARLSVARDFAVSGDYRKAISLCSMVLAQAPGHGEALKLAGGFALAMGAVDQAITLLEQYARTGPADIEVLCALGDAHRQAGHPGQATRAFRAALERDPDCQPARDGLAALAPADTGASVRGELGQDMHVFFVTAWGYAADHWFGWFPKALNCHPEMFALLAHEGSRPKYFNERTRGERPPIIPFAHFLNDMGMTYQAIGDCYSYRASQLAELRAEFGDDIPLANLLRHPYVWLEFYIRWRASNMRMPGGSTGPLDWEWGTVDHDLYRALALKPYAREDIAVWAAYQGMRQLNQIVNDQVEGVWQLPIESVVASREVFQDLVRHLSKGRCEYSPALLDQVYGFVNTPFRGEERLRMVPGEIVAQWPDWKRDAFEKLVKPETIALYEKYGYVF